MHPMAPRASWREGADALHRDLVRVFGERLRSLLVYDAHGASLLAADEERGGAAGAAADPDAAHATRPHEQRVHTMAVVDSLRMDDLRACGALAADWARQGLSTPLLLLPTELGRSLDAFPLEFSQIMAHHVVLAGADPFEQLGVKAEDVRRACEVQARSHLLHLREGFIEAEGRPAAIAVLIAASSAPFRALLGSVARLQGSNARTPDQLATYAETALAVPAALVRKVLQISRPDDLDPSDAIRLYGEYLDATERLVKIVDEWAR
jgi:hypothetical protein